MSNRKMRLKQLLLNGWYGLGGYDCLRLLQRRMVPILFYHRFSVRDEPFKLKIDRFEHQLRFFKKKYNLISLSHFTNAMSNGKGLPPNPLIITIDDGFWDNYHIAFPVLKRHGVPATIFLATDFVDQHAWLWSNKLEYILRNSEIERFSYSLDGHTIELRVDTFEQWHKSQLTLFNALRRRPDNEKNEILAALAKQLKVSVPSETQGDFKPLTWHEIREMYRAGIEFGSHSASHAILSRVGPEQLKREVVDSRAIIENVLQNRVVTFCYPNGQPEDFSEDAIQALKEAGYECAVTTIKGLNPAKAPQPFALKRISVGAADVPRMAKQIQWPD